MGDGEYDLQVGADFACLEGFFASLFMFYRDPIHFMEDCLKFQK